jgi:hypothetical protein
MTQKVVLAVNTSAAASTPVYLAITGAAAAAELSLRLHTVDVKALTAAPAPPAHWLVPAACP